MIPERVDHVERRVNQLEQWRNLATCDAKRAAIDRASMSAWEGRQRKPPD